MAKMKFNILDRIISAVAPEAAYRRLQFRKALNLINTRRFDAAAGGRRTSQWVATSTSANSEIHNALTFRATAAATWCVIMVMQRKPFRKLPITL